MGSFLFKWEHPASEVYVTGTFDDWKKTEKLEKIDDRFEKTVTLQDASKKIYYKFVVDGNWVTDHTVPKEVDESGNENNVLTPERIIVEAPATTAIMSSVAPDSTTAALAADVPLEKKAEAEELPGTFPETPAASAPAETEKGGDFSVNPLPATAGAVNPIKLAPGEKIPENLAAAAPTDNVKLDPESYEKSDTLPGGVPVILSSAAPESTTAALAASAPIETKVPEVVKESQEKANAEPEASAVPEEVKDKAAVEDELLEKVKEAPSTSEGTAGEGTEKTEKVVSPGEAAASVAAAATAVGGAAVAGAFAAKDAAVEKATGAASTVQASVVEAAATLPEPIKEQLPESVQNAIATTTKEETREEVSPEVPAEVKESIVEAGKAPEAAANTEAVEDKKAVETELLKEVKPVEAVEEPLKSEPTESKDAAGESSEIQIPAAAESTATNGANGVNGANGTQETVKPVEVKPTETTEATETAAPATPAAPADATTSSSAKATDGSASVEKKKKNRFSALFGKVKSKLSNK
ncbi:carbohydrate-binding module family 48 protein [Annulohypoxylon maeteangense]|uniref:carbohydrate-binding module family 48 protein n=1 Tax=Annulohypoxylon maeteangense TaxID=1927788 RepID=UPI0020077965|nr:carbohydrate-binding module family 48 protein [Annulohypoxylon maeteangense]KAI0885703.1 carbohydrate-binding module family 48 protein [Annulohypoxylon maeteangense]